MSEFVGVKCSSCGEFIPIEKQVHSRAIAYAAPYGPVSCKCGSVHVYTTDQLVDEVGVRPPSLP